MPREFQIQLRNLEMLLTNGAQMQSCLVIVIVFFEECIHVVYMMIARRYPYEERVLANCSKQLVYHTQVFRASSRGVQGVSRAIILSPKFHTINALWGAFMRKISHLDSVSIPNCTCLTQGTQNFEGAASKADDKEWQSWQGVARWLVQSKHFEVLLYCVSSYNIV